MVGHAERYVQVILSRQEIEDLHNDIILNYYDNLCNTHRWNPDGFNREDLYDIQSPAMWYFKCMKEMLNTIVDESNEVKVRYITIMFKINIIYKHLFNYPSFSGKYKRTSQDKAREILRSHSNSVTDEVKNILRHFLNVVP